MNSTAPKDGSKLLAWLGIAAISIGLGAASGIGSSGFSFSVAAWHTALLILVQGLFFVILPTRLKQPIQILVAMVFGTLFGWILASLGEDAFVIEYLNIYGTLFILLLKLVVTPLIFVSIICGVAGIGDISRLGKLGGKTIVYYLGTTGLAVLSGLLVVNVLQPGSRTEGLELPTPAVSVASPAPGTGAETESPAPERSVGKRIQEDLLPFIVQNPIMAGQNPLVIIFFALLLGAALAAGRETSGPVIAVFNGLDKALITIVLWIMTLAPIGVFTLMAAAIAQMGLDYIGALAFYFATVLIGLGLHWCVLVFIILGVLVRFSPWRYIRGMAPALELAFSTSSSSATLPVTIDCAANRVGVDKDVANFMLPVGATINMDGTAVYQSIAAIFIAEVYGIDLHFGQQAAIFFTAVTVSIGTAGIPGASLGLMAIVLASAGIPIEGVGIVAGVDRLLDMCRTVVNITGDSVGAVVISKTEGTLTDPAQVDTVSASE